MSVARFLIEDMGHFQHFEGRDLHAHMQPPPHAWELARHPV